MESCLGFWDTSVRYRTGAVLCSAEQLHNQACVCVVGIPNPLAVLSVALLPRCPEQKQG